MAGDPVKIAELAVGNTYVGRIHVAIYDPGHLAVRHLYLAQLIGYKHQFGKRGMLKQVNTFFYTQPFKAHCLVIQFL